jgi:SAM-dependent methyltransferase
MTEPEFVSATRASYDAIAADYVTWIEGELAVRPLDRALLAGFVDLVQSAGGGPIADIGCGPGRITAHLDALGADVFGIDLSPRMIEQARRAHPALRFEVGSMLSLDLPDDSLAGIIAWYSVIHVSDDLLPSAFAEFHRVLAVGGHLLVAFQVGAEVSQRTEAAGHAIALDFHHRQPDQVADLLDHAGFDVRARVRREADPEPPYPEKTPQGFLIARNRDRGSAAF